MEQQEFLDHAYRIVEEGQERGAALRLLGAVAFHLHCPKYQSFQEKAGRPFTDLDFAAYFKHNEQIRDLFASMNFWEDREVAVVYARQRLVFNDPNSTLHVDVFFDKLDFCHPIPWAGRLEVDTPTIPLAEMLLEKMQIVKLNAKDVIDTLMLLREHALDEGDADTINVRRVARLCAQDWGLWRTFTMNLPRIMELSQGYGWLGAEDRAVIGERIDQLLAILEKEPKSTSWIARSLVGDRVQWYKDVHEVNQ
ncbi:MAG: hypothetical protein V1755_11400 [Chloroflexota bacterium]